MQSLGTLPREQLGMRRSKQLRIQPPWTELGRPLPQAPKRPRRARRSRRWRLSVCLPLVACGLCGEAGQAIGPVSI